MSCVINSFSLCLASFCGLTGKRNTPTGRTGPPRPSAAGSRRYAAWSWASAVSATTSPEACPTPADSGKPFEPTSNHPCAPKYEEPLIRDRDPFPCSHIPRTDSGGQRHEKPFVQCVTHDAFPAVAFRALNGHDQTLLGQHGADLAIGAIRAVCTRIWREPPLVAIPA